MPDVLAGCFLRASSFGTQLGLPCAPRGGFGGWWQSVIGGTVDDGSGSGGDALLVGGVVCDDCRPPGAALIDFETSILLAALLTGDWDVVSAASEKNTQAASGIVSAYCQWHIERGLKSLQHVERNT